MARRYWANFPEFVEREIVDGKGNVIKKKYQRDKEFCDTYGLKLRIIGPMLGKYALGQPLYIDSFKQGGEVGRWYINIEEAKRLPQRVKAKAFSNIPGRIDVDGNSYIPISEYCKINKVPKTTVISRAKSTKIHAIKRQIGNASLWYIFVGYSKGVARIDYLRGVVRKLEGAKRGRIARELEAITDEDN